MRASGILMPISALPSPYGIGTMGQQARQFVDFLHKAGQSYWQILPICPTSYGDSPYQSFSTYAGNPYFIDLDELAAQGLLRPKEYKHIDWQCSPECINYGVLYQERYAVLHLACERLLAAPPAEYRDFVKQNRFWLPDYALFMALKDAHGGACWQQWAEPLRRREADAVKAARKRYAKEIAFWQAVQYLFFRQWQALKDYANARNIQIIGDLPIYIALDSVDVWSDPHQFQLDEHLNPTEVAGCPPDGFSATGQLWGNPLYDWDAMAKDGFAWWVRRIKHMCSIYDVVRIDHFRGFAGYYAIPYGSETAACGRWRTGPGYALFAAIKKKLGAPRIIAEDLGFLTEDVNALLRKCGYPGMKVLEFGFDSRDGGEYRPHSYPVNSIAYVGTHDNEPVNGWVETAAPEDIARAVQYLNLTKQEGYHWGMMRGIWASASELAIVQAQDILGLGHEARMNTPSTVGSNWCWRAKRGVFNDRLAARLYQAAELYDRLPR
ncbi:4-alpha-glucanotransferase [uncultured Gemmiger sp.]|uniref:4-alpha-glucanotransferase n=1 Tax=uncultured Gemmiger sp. TaxID=1623490 RepID=UPI0025EFC998|nr:4-alpha-glucanotransferase [uncultured Gemmiger sp.]